MKFKKQTKAIKIFSFFLTFVICLGGASTGAYAASPDPLPKDTSTQDAVTEGLTDIVIDLASSGQNSITQSGSFEAEDGQILTLTVLSDIRGGSVNLTFFSPDNKEQRITFSGSDVTKTIELSAGRWGYNCTGFFEGGSITIIGTIPQSPERHDNTITQGNTLRDAKDDGTAVLNLSNSGQNRLLQSGDFEAEDNQVLTIAVQSDIKGGLVNLTLFSPDHKEQCITISGSNDTKSITLSAGRWAYNCTGFFESGNITIIGEIK